MDTYRSITFQLLFITALHLLPSNSLPLNPEELKEKVTSQFMPIGGEESHFFEGDIRLRPGEDPYKILTPDKPVRSKRMTDQDLIFEEGHIMEVGSGEDSLNPTEEHIWPEKQVPWEYFQYLSTFYRDLYAEAMRAIENATCIKFVHRREETEDYLHLTHSEEYGCSSFVGMKGGLQMVTLSSGCATVGHAIHELGHALGLWHEHSRPDRNEYIRVNYNNIKETEQDNFGILDESKFSLVPDVGYDIESIMHYGEYAFHRNRRKTIELREDAPVEDCINRLRLGQRIQLSYKDKLRLNKLYSCERHIEELTPPLCEKPQPTPVTATDTMPTPTPSQRPTPPPITISRRLNTGNVLAFEFEHLGESKGMRCTPSPGCIPARCERFFGEETCLNLEHQFTIYNPDSKKIKSGNTVVLRSRYKPSSWLDCASDSRRRCTLSQCVDNSADTLNTSTISECVNHQFQIVGVNRRDGQILNKDHKVQLRHLNGAYLNCSGKRCQLLDEPQTFSIRKLRDS